MSEEVEKAFRSGIDSFGRTIPETPLFMRSGTDLMELTNVELKEEIERRICYGGFYQTPISNDVICYELVKRLIKLEQKIDHNL